MGRLESTREGHSETEESQTLAIDDGIDLSLIGWMAALSPEDRLQAAQNMIDTVWELRHAERSS